MLDARPVASTLRSASHNDMVSAHVAAANSGHARARSAGGTAPAQRLAAPTTERENKNKTICVFTLVGALKTVPPTSAPASAAHAGPCGELRPERPLAPRASCSAAKSALYAAAYTHSCPACVAVAVTMAAEENLISLWQRNFTVRVQPRTRRLLSNSAAVPERGEHQRVGEAHFDAVQCAVASAKQDSERNHTGGTQLLRSERHAARRVSARTEPLQREKARATDRLSKTRSDS